jgi:hypothetical protein
MQVCSVQAQLQGKTFLPPRCTLFRRSGMAFERVLHVANGSNVDKSPDHNLMVASRVLLSQASAILTSWGVSHKLVHPHEAIHRSQPVLPHLLCTGDIPGKLRDQMCSLQDLQLLSCEPGVHMRPCAADPKVAQRQQEHFWIVVVPDEWIVEFIPEAKKQDNQVGAVSLTGFARLELVRLRRVCPEALVILARSVANMQPCSSDLCQDRAIACI